MKQNQAQKKKKKKIDWRRIFVTVLALIMAIALLLPLFSGLFGARAVTQGELKDQISNLKGDANDAAARKKELQAQIDALQDDKEQAMEKKNLLARQLNEIDAQIANTQSQIELYDMLILEQEIALQEARYQEAYAYDRFCQRARSMEEAGTVSYWSVLFAAKDFADLLDRLALVDQIMEYDNSVVDTLAEAR
ncbi:MAG: peptidase M23, partial [Oscillospiraceae bacterium]|nr:peptidase M23 [Oscillospiraceae bacterium]